MKFSGRICDAKDRESKKGEVEESFSNPANLYPFIPIKTPVAPRRILYGSIMSL